MWARHPQWLLASGSALLALQDACRTLQETQDAAIQVAAILIEDGKKLTNVNAGLDEVSARSAGRPSYRL